MTRFRTAEDLQRLFDARVAETVSLEYKRELDLGSRSQRLETLKDLTGMANGGGGTVLYGIAEASAADPVPDGLYPLTDLTVVGVLEDVVRSGVRPPLLMDYEVVPVDGGSVLAVDVDPSPLGPYMVHAYGDARYYHRSLTRTTPMSEQQVRDAYTLAVRGRENRAQSWADRALPMTALSESPWLTVSALPEEPLTDVIDVAAVEPDALRPPGLIDVHLRSGIRLPLESLGRWADGYFADEVSQERGTKRSVRLHRDGAAALGAALHSRVSPVTAARHINGVLAYLAWLWTQFDLRQPVEIDITLHNLSDATLDVRSLFGDEELVREPSGVPIHHATIREQLIVPDIYRARTRHRVVRRFTDNLYQAFGFAQCEPLFRTGQLYGRDARPLQLSIAGGGVWGDQTTARAIVYDDGSVRHTRSDAEVIGHFVEGAIIDPAGGTLAVLEMASGTGCPDDFLPAALSEDPRARVPRGGPGTVFSASVKHPAPAATGRWSENDFLPLLRA